MHPTPSPHYHDHAPHGLSTILRRYAAPIATALALLMVAVIAWRVVANTFRVTIGVEGKRVVEIAGPQLFAAPFTPGDAVSLRIAETKKTARGFRYDLCYIAYGPGQHDLSKFLMLAGNKKADALPKLFISVNSILPPEHGGELFDTRESAIDLHSNYNLWILLSWLSWGALLVPLLLIGRKHRAATPPTFRAPSIAQRLEGMLIQASRGELNAVQQADLEKLLLGFWSRRLNLSGERLPLALEHLKSHPTAGRQIALVERWIHSRSKAGDASLAKELIAELGAELRKERTEPAGAHA